MTDEIYALWSGGIDSTVLVAYLLNEGSNVKPYYINRLWGHSPREKEALEKLYPELKKRYGDSLSKLEIIKKRIGKSERRNAKLIKTLLEYEGEVRKVALGSYTGGIRDGFVLDNSYEYLSKETGVEVITWESFGVKDKESVVETAKKLGVYELLRYAWTCQHWFKKPCGKCYSCKRARELLKDFEIDFIHKTKDEAIRFLEKQYNLALKVLAGEEKKDILKLSFIPDTCPDTFKVERTKNLTHKIGPKKLVEGKFRTYDELNLIYTLSINEIEGYFKNHKYITEKKINKILKKVRTDITQFKKI